MEYSKTGTETEMLPPPYTASAEGFDEEEEEDLPTTNITIHAPTIIHGSHNVVPVSLMDSTRLAAVFTSLLSQKIAAQGAGRQSNFNVQINCGVNVIGDRNILGHLGVRPRPVQSSSVAEGVVAETALLGKRKASEVCCKLSISPFEISG